jgi:hypothetical protein
MPAKIPHGIIQWLRLTAPASSFCTQPFAGAEIMMLALQKIHAKNCFLLCP